MVHKNMSRIPFIKTIIFGALDEFMEAYEMDIENNPYTEEYTFGGEIKKYNESPDFKYLNSNTLQLGTKKTVSKEMFKRMIYITVNDFKLSEYEEYDGLDCVLFQHMQELYVEKLEEHILYLESENKILKNQIFKKKK